MPAFVSLQNRAPKNRKGYKELSEIAQEKWPGASVQYTLTGNGKPGWYLHRQRIKFIGKNWDEALKTIREMEI